MPYPRRVSLPAQPDSVLRFLPAERPAAFDRLPERERAWRGRTFLMMTSAGYEPVHAWFFALLERPDWVHYARDEMVGGTPDSEILKMVETAAWYRQARQLQMNEA